MSRVQDQNAFKEPGENNNRLLGISLLIVQIGSMIAYGLAGFYGSSQAAKAETILRGETVSLILMALFTIVGFGLLLNIYRFANWLGLTSSIVIVALNIQLSPLLQKFWFSVFITGFSPSNTVISGSTVSDYWTQVAGNNIGVNNQIMRTTLLSSISLMTVMTAVVGRISLAQTIKMVSFYQVFWNLNYNLLIYLYVIFRDQNNIADFSPLFFDFFGTTYVYLFAVFFGIPLTCLLTKQKFDAAHPRNQYSKSSLLLSQIGTGFLCALFVFSSCGVINYSFNGNSRGDHYARFAILFGILGGVLGSYLGSALLNKGRVGFKEALTGTMTGSIVLGSVAPMIENIGIIIMIGSVAGLISAFYMSKIHPLVNKHYIKDVLGIFGPFAVASILGSLVVTPAVSSAYFNKGMGFTYNTAVPLLGSFAGWQLVAVGISAGIGLGAGLFTAIFNLCDRQYFALASNSRIFANDFGLRDSENEKPNAYTAGGPSVTAQPIYRSANQL